MRAQGGTARTLARAVPPALLVLVAASQLWLAHARGLTAWCGGGFGMFSTIDGWGARHLHATLLGDGWRQEVEVPGALRELEERALALPDDERLEPLARALLREELGALGEPRSVEIRVFTRRFERASLEPEGVLLRSFELRVE